MSRNHAGLLDAPAVAGALFTPATVTVSARAEFAATRARIPAAHFLPQFQRGDWGVARPEWQTRNRIALHTAGRLIGAYRGHPQLSVDVFLYAYDPATKHLRILLEDEWQAEERASPPEWQDDRIRPLLEREVALAAEKDRVGAALAATDVSGAERAETEALAARDAALVSEAASDGTETDVKAAQRRYDAARGHHEMLARKASVLTSRLRDLDREIAATVEERTARVTALMTAERRREATIVAAIEQREADGREALTLLARLAEKLQALKVREHELAALGLSPNPHFLAGCGSRLEAILRNETPPAIDQEAWRS